MLLPDLCHQRARLTPGATAFIDLPSSRLWTFGDVAERVARGAAWLRDMGLEEGDRLAILCHNTPVFFEMLFACQRAGIILVPLNWRQTVAELAPILSDCAPKLLLHDDSTAQLAESLNEGTARMPLSAFDMAGDAHDGALPPAPWPAERPWYLLYTSGTTGRPKAVIQTAGMALANMVNVQQATGIDARTKALNFLPLFHTAGINLHTLPVFFAGGVSRVLPKFDAEAVLRLVAEGALTVFFGVPQIYQMLSLHPDFDATDLARVTHWGCGGAPISAQLIAQFLERGVPICNGMGMTETGPTVFFMDRTRAAEKIGSVGQPQILAEVRLVDAAGNDVQDGAEGELLFRGPGITPGYYGNPEATAAAFAPGGWLRSGDIGRRDADGFYSIVDRIKDMYISGGENVYPAEVERALLTHPCVLEAAVLGMPDATWGEVGHAAVLLRAGETLTAEAMRQHARGLLAAYKVPKHITIVDDFPRTAAGKIQKHVLRALLLEGRA